MTEDQIKHMINRFLRWKLPENFNPDAGISFKATFNEHTNHPMKYEPSGTNLFDAVQAEAMVRYMLDGMPAAADGRKPYAHEYGRSNGDGTFSVVIERGEPKRPSPDWTIKPLYQAEPATLAVPEEMVKALREALKPFAGAADVYDPPKDDDRDIAWAHDLTIGSLRRARAALTGNPSLPSGGGKSS